jgi:hypothetical protein
MYIIKYAYGYEFLFNEIKNVITNFELNINDKCSQTLNCIFKNYFFKSHILKLYFLKLKT